MKVNLFWNEIKQEDYTSKEYGTLYHERYTLTHTEPDLDAVLLEDLPYIEAPIIERLPNKTVYFTFNRLDVERIIHRRPRENVLGIILEDLVLIMNRGYLSKFDVPLPDVEFILSTSYSYPPRIVQLLGAYHTTGDTWSEERIAKIKSGFKRSKERLVLSDKKGGDKVDEP